MDLYDRVSHQRESGHFQQSDVVYPEHPTLGSPFMQADIVYSPDLPSPPNAPLQTHFAVPAAYRPSLFKRIDSTISATTNFFSDFSPCSPQFPEHASGPASLSKRVKEQDDHKSLSQLFVEPSYTPPHSTETWKRDLSHDYYPENTEYGYASSDSGTFVGDVSWTESIGEDNGDDDITVRFSPISPASDHEEKGKSIITVTSYPDAMVYGVDVQYSEDTNFFDRLDEAWENISATLEQSRLEWREMCLGWQPSDGESSKSFSAFLAMHEGHYDRMYDGYYFDRWLTWHRMLDRAARQAVRREAAAATAYNRSQHIRYTRPHVRPRSFSQSASVPMLQTTASRHDSFVPFHKRSLSVVF